MPESSCGTYLLGRVPNGTLAKAFFSSFVLTTNSASILKQFARDDARRYVYNAVASFLGAMAGIHNQHYAWSVTKLYYCTFYVARAALCRSDRVIFHVPKIGGNGHTQYELAVQAGRSPEIVAKLPSTHKLVAQIGYPKFMTGLVINNEDPLNWLMEQREYWQYRAARFSDPGAPNILDQFSSNRMHRLLQEYASDKIGLYLSDPSHAVISVPFRLLTWSLSLESLTATETVDMGDIKHLRKRCQVGKETFNIISQYLI